MKWIIAFLAGLMLACIVRADEFDDTFAKYRAAKAKPVKKACACDGEPARCDCNACDCAGGSSCRVATSGKYYVGTIAVIDKVYLNVDGTWYTLAFHDESLRKPLTDSSRVKVLGHLGYDEKTLWVDKAEILYKAKPVEVRCEPPTTTFKHDCGCPSLPCNCDSGGCHCSENRVDNRQSARWVRDGDYWYLYRGSQCLGAMKVNGSAFYQWNGMDYLPTPLKPPSVPPYRVQEQSMAIQAAPICRT